MKALLKDRHQRTASVLDFARDFARAASTSGPAGTSLLGPTKVVDLLNRERVDQKRLAQEKAEAERHEREKAAAEQAAREKAEQARLAREKAEAERRQREDAAAEQAARQKVEEQFRSGAQKRQRLDQLVNEGKGAFDAHQYGKAAMLWRKALELGPDAPGLREAVEMAEKAAARGGRQHADAEWQGGENAAAGRRSEMAPAERTGAFGEDAAPTPTDLWPVEPIVTKPVPPSPKAYPRRKGLLTTVLLWAFMAVTLVGLCLSAYKDCHEWGCEGYFRSAVLLIPEFTLPSFALLAFFLWSGMHRVDRAGFFVMGFVHRWKKLTLGTLAVVYLLGEVAWVRCMVWVRWAYTYFINNSYFYGYYYHGWNRMCVISCGLCSWLVTISSFVILWRLGWRRSAFALLIPPVVVAVGYFFFLRYR
jgi:hypothetical protein